MIPDDRDGVGSQNVCFDHLTRLITLEDFVELCSEILTAVKLSAFMKAEGSLPRSQETATGPYLEPDEPSSNPHTREWSDFYYIWKQTSVSCS